MDLNLLEKLKSFDMFYNNRKRKTIVEINSFEKEVLSFFYNNIFIDGQIILDKKEYNLFEKILDHLSDKNIFNFLDDRYFVLYLLNIKYKSKIKFKLVDDKIYFKEEFICFISDISIFVKFDVKSDKLIISGDFIDCFDKYKLYININSCSKELNDCFIEEVQLCDFESLSFKIELNNNSYDLNICFDKFFSNKFPYLYVCNDKKIIKYDKNKKILCQKNNFFNRFKLEIMVLYKLIKLRKFRVLLLRLYVKMFLVFKCRELWIVNDLNDSSLDKDFFKFIIGEKLNPDIKYFYSNFKKNKSYKIMYNDYSNVIKINSFRYKYLYFVCDKYISSVDRHNPLDEDIIYMKDLITSEFILLEKSFKLNKIDNCDKLYTKISNLN